MSTTDEARAVTAALEYLPLDDMAVNSTILDIRIGLEEEQKGRPFSVRELFTWEETQNLRRLIILISI
jgi:hypothetical protein